MNTNVHGKHIVLHLRRLLFNYLLSCSFWIFLFTIIHFVAPFTIPFIIIASTTYVAFMTDTANTSCISLSSSIVFLFLLCIACFVHMTTCYCHNSLVLVRRFTMRMGVSLTELSSLMQHNVVNVLCVFCRNSSNVLTHNILHYTLECSYSTMYCGIQ